MTAATKVHLNSALYTACGRARGVQTRLAGTRNAADVTCLVCRSTEEWRALLGERPGSDAGARPAGYNVRIAAVTDVAHAARRGIGLYGVYMGGAVRHLYRASLTDFTDVVERGRRWCEAHGYQLVSVTRPLTHAQLADLPTKWENPTVDVRKYIQTCTEAWETDAQTYRLTRGQGGLCQQWQGKFYIGR